MLSFLKKLGQIIVQGAQIIGGFAPILDAAAPKAAGVIQVVSTDLSALATVVTSVEATSAAIAAGGTTLTGAQKLAMAIPLVGQIVNQSNVVAGKKIADPALLQTAITEYAQATVDLLNAIHPDEAGNMVVASVKT